jgi:hypothetical protein
VREAEREWAEIQARQRETWELYSRPEFQPDAVPPDNAALWYGLLPKSPQHLVHGPGPRFAWTVFDYDTDRYGLHPAPGLDDIPPEAEFARDAHHLAIVNAPAVELFVRASRIEHCDFEAATHLWGGEEDGPLRRPGFTLRLFSRLMFLDARSHWTSGRYRLSLGRIAAVARCGRHLATIDDTGPLTALATTRWAMDEALLALGEWPEPGPSERDGRELAAAISAIDPADPCGVAAAWRQEALDYAQRLITESAAHGSGAPMGARVRRERLVMRREDLADNLSDLGLFVIHDGPLPLESMSAAEIEAAVEEALPRVGRVYRLMIEGGTVAEIEAEVEAAMADPEVIEPLLLVGVVGTARMVEEWRERRNAVLQGLGASDS